MMSYLVDCEMFSAVAARSLCGIQVDNGVKSSQTLRFEGS